MDYPELQVLCSKREGSRLDFKLESYRVPGGTKPEKQAMNQELAKDLVSIANVVGRSKEPGYILVGVAENSDKTGRIVGLSRGDHEDDAAWHQKVRPWVNRVPDFTYHVVDIPDDLTVGVFEIRGGQRPFSVDDRGKGAVTEVAFVREGSATERASPDQIGAWIRADLTSGARAALLKSVEQELIAFLVSTCSWPAVRRPHPDFLWDVPPDPDLLDISPDWGTPLQVSRESMALIVVKAALLFGPRTPADALGEAAVSPLLADDIQPERPTELQQALRRTHEAIRHFQRLKTMSLTDESYQGISAVVQEGGSAGHVNVDRIQAVGLVGFLLWAKRASVEALNVLSHLRKHRALRAKPCTGIPTSALAGHGDSVEAQQGIRTTLTTWIDSVDPFGSRPATGGDHL